MQDRTYTIALFGAFSAGKSSFANALLGESVLPVSPNPTTATINRILPPDVDHPHGTAVVRFKSEAQLLKDINQSLELSEQCTTEQQNAEEQQQLSHSLKLLTTDNRRFLSAVQKGLPAIYNFLVQLTRSTNQIIRFVAFDVAQELRSTSIRIERYIKLVYERIHGNLSEQIGSIDRGFVLPKFNTGDIVAPVFSEGLREVSASKMKDILANYKDRESFFTAEGDQVLRDELDARLREPVQRLLSESHKTIIEVYVTAFKKELLQIKKQAAVYAEQYFTGLLATLSNKADVAALDNMYNRLLHISKNIKS
ncbi:dynamin family protein [Aneurinibacillus sp. Ricciae_BoGa-3]|nr:dynamin family protein [Aneurinibacillus sp. Ricciae_BoGa-3]WCK52688.1 dynamin family protein [Aneurinibacillus sp. Ricciae_BoGa-3]